MWNLAPAHKARYVARLFSFGVTVCAFLASALVANAAPLRLVVAVDLHKDAAGFDVRTLLEPVFDSLQDEDLVGVWGVGSKEVQLSPMTSGDARRTVARSVLRRGLKASPRDYLLTVDFMMNHVQQTFVESGLDGQRLMVIVSTGPDAAPASTAETVLLLNAAQVQVHSLLLGASASQAAAELAIGTGGRVYRATKPGDGYASAKALAKNLQRLRSGEPLVPSSEGNTTADSQPKPRKPLPQKAPASDNSVEGADEDPNTAEAQRKPSRNSVSSTRDREKTTRRDGDGREAQADSEGDSPRTRRRVRRQTTLEDDEGAAASADAAEGGAESEPGVSWILWVGMLMGVLCMVAGGLWWWSRRRDEPQEVPAPVTNAPSVSYDAYFSGGGDSSSASDELSSATFVPLTTGEAFSMVPGSKPLRIGRKSENDIVIEQSGVSGRHAELFWRDGRLCVRDLGSTNGTYVDDVRVDEQSLNAGNIVRFDAIAFTVEGLQPISRSASSSGAGQKDDRTMVLSADDPMLRELLESQSAEAPMDDKTAMLDASSVIELQHAHCLRHTNRIAHSVCSVCTCPYCSECLVEVMSEMMCPKCRAAGHG